MTPVYDRLNRQLRTAADNTPVERIAAAKRTTDRLAEGYAAETSSSQHEHVVGALARLRHASAALDTALARTRQVITSIAVFGDQIGANPVHRSGQLGPSGSRPEDGASAAGHGDPDSSPAETGVPETVARFAGALPRRVGEHDKTEGFLLSGDQPIHDSVFTAETDGRIRSRRLRSGAGPAAGAGLKPPAARATVMDHVEAQAAAVLRRPGAPTDARWC